MSQRVFVLAGTIKGLFIFESDTDRQKWQVHGPYLNGWEVYSVLGDGRHGQRIFAGTSHMAYGPSLRVSEDFGETWQEIEQGPSYPTETGFKLNRFWQIIPGHEIAARHHVCRARKKQGFLSAVIAVKVGAN